MNGGLVVVAKVCTRCGEGKTLEEFSIKSSGKYGRDSWCRDCKNADRRERGVNSRGTDVSVKVHRSIREVVRAEASRHGVTQRQLLNYVIAAGIRALREGKLRLPEETSRAC